MKILIDINVFMNVLTKRAGWVESLTLIDVLSVHGITSHISALTVAVLQFLRVKKVGEMRAPTEVKTIAQGLEIVPLTSHIILDALASHMPEFEDNIQFYSAREMKVDYIVTRNKKHFLQQEIPVVTPDEFLHLIGVLN
ncbi:PIN domain-containing protein [candidate division KSB1 bacterium]|nr:PIN domain-containing protein [candidate division KSB1 bacterium]